MATDLSSRCDRAMQRALQLAKLWKSRLVILTVVEPDDASDPTELWDLPTFRRPADTRRVAEDQIRRQFSEIAYDAEVKILEGEPVATIEAVARDVGADLIVTGVGRDEAFGRFLLGSTVERLARQTPVPLLIVKSRVWPYEEILVATDLSEPSQHALMAADRFFPTAPLTAMHVWEAPFAGFLDRPGLREPLQAQEKEGCEDFIQRSQLSPDARVRVKALVAHGRPEAQVRRYMLEKEVDLVVIGAHGRSGLFDRPLGGTARRILEFSPGDVLLIRDPRAVRRGALSP